jgi:hypothetical protein
MGAYRCVLLGLTREVETIEEIDALTKRGARKIARATLQRSPMLWAFELWRGKKLLYRETQTPPIEGESRADLETHPKVLDIWRATNVLVKRHGAAAAIVAAQRADELLAAGDFEGSEVWKRILVAVDELTRAKPAESERVS